MRPLELRTPSFAVGFALGLVLSGVALAFARVARRRAEHPEQMAHPVIDGAKPIDPVALTVGPAVEEGAAFVRLESELEEPPLNSQRW